MKTARQSPEEIMALCMEMLPFARTFTDAANIRIAGRMAWEEKEMGGIEHVQFAHRNNTPIVPQGHCCHPLELVKRGFIDGHGWPKAKPATALDRVEYFKWQDGNHWYARVDGRDVVVNGAVKWNTREQAQEAARKFMTSEGTK
jgi:hypothetical protein